jgi:predicted Zn-dependent peptidase
MVDYEIHEFSNGIRLVHKQIGHSRIAHLGFILDVGSRDELPNEEGLAHFWEHMAFKGTTRRKAFHILNRLEAVGGELNASTTREKIAFYASLLDLHTKKAAELLADITFHSTFPEREIEKERQVILEEMSMYRDTPDDAIFDDFDEMVFSNHPLGTNILGTEKTVSSFNRDDFRRFITRATAPGRVIFSSVANIPLKKMVAMLEPHLADVELKGEPQVRTPAVPGPPERRIVRKSITQSHIVMGLPAFSLYHPDRLAFFMLTNILGGPGANSRLNLALRERHGYVYGVDAGFTSYTDTGLFSIYFATDPKRMNKSLQLAEKEMKLLREKPLGTAQLHLAKEQLMGQLAMAEESNSGLMMVLGRDILDHGKVETLQSIFDQIRGVTSKRLQDLSNQFLNPDSMWQLIYEAEGSD